MSDHGEQINILDETTKLEPSTSGNAFRVGMGVGIVCLGASFGLGFLGTDGVTDWARGYLIALMFWLSIALGGLFFVLIQHLTAAGWSVTVRRLGEFCACTLPLLGILTLPVVFLAGDLFEWVSPNDDKWHQEHAHEDHAAPHGDEGATGAADGNGEGEGDGEHVESEAISADAGDTAEGDAHESAAAHDHHRAAHVALIESKSAYLNMTFFVIRLFAGFLILSLIAWWLFRRSREQDVSGDPTLTSRMATISAPSMFLFALFLTLFAFDLLMSLDPAWFSTIFGVYYFAGANVGFYAFAIILALAFQRAGLAQKSITKDHYHDLGKLMFAFVIFWGYIAFSQYMLIWYGAIPEETAWYEMKAADNPGAWSSGWNYVSFVLLFGHLLIPLLGFMSRYVKRNLGGMAFWAVWMLAFHYLDLYWIVRPMFSPDSIPVQSLPGDVFAFVGIGALFVGVILKLAGSYRMIPIRDPRVYEAIQFENH